MTQRSAEKVANLMMGAAALAGTYYVLKTPQLRRVAWRLLVTALTGTVPAWVSQEIKNGWDASGSSSGAYPRRTPTGS
jgi:hypothetical protein